MFDSLTERLGGVFENLKRRGALSESDVDAALREVRVALLEADVALPVAKNFIDGVRDRAVGAEALRSVSPAQMVVKIVHDRLIEVLGPETADVEFHAAAPASVLIVGLQGSGRRRPPPRSGAGSPGDGR